MRSLPGQTFAITIIPVDDQTATLLTNRTLTVREGFAVRYVHLLENDIL
jgi:hypothetical protein